MYWMFTYSYDYVDDDDDSDHVSFLVCDSGQGLIFKRIRWADIVFCQIQSLQLTHETTPNTEVSFLGRRRLW